MIWENRSSADGGRAVFSRPGKAGGWPTGQGGGEAARFAGDVGTGGGTPGRRALRRVREVSSTTLGRGSTPKPLGGQADSGGPQGTGAARRGRRALRGKVQEGVSPSWFPALAAERSWIIFCRGVYVAKNPSHGATCEKGPAPVGAGPFLRQSGVRGPSGCAGGASAIVPPCGTGLFKKSQIIFPAACTAGKFLDSAALGGYTSDRCHW